MLSTYSAYLKLFDLSTLNNTWREVKIAQLFDIQFSLALSDISSAVQMVSSNILSLCSSVYVTDHVLLTSVQKTSNYILLYFNLSVCG
jgi:hypothetical protein